MIKENPSLISKAFKGQLVIPDFDSFTKDITQIYERYQMVLNIINLVNKIIDAKIIDLESQLATFLN